MPESTIGVCLRARYARDFTDDKHELEFGVPFVAEALRSFDGAFGDKGSLTRTDYFYVADELEAGNLTPAGDDGVYVASFSKTSDGAHMWKHYPFQGGGYCIELRKGPVVTSGFTMLVRYSARRSPLTAASYFDLKKSAR